MTGPKPQTEPENPSLIIEGRFSRKAILSFVFGILSLAFAGVGESDLYLLGPALFWSVALVLGVLSLREVAHSSGRLRGGAFAVWGIGLPLALVLLGFFLQPFV